MSNCTIFLECTSGLGDTLFDVAAGVTVALARACVLPRVRTRWQHRLDQEPGSHEDAAARMKLVNPVIIPRNHIVEEALNEALRLEQEGAQLGGRLGGIKFREAQDWYTKAFRLNPELEKTV